MGLDLLAGTVGRAHCLAERRDRRIGLAFAVEAALERGEPLEKQGVAVLRMDHRARQLLDDFLD
jgi:hypothetical protein